MSRLVWEERLFIWWYQEKEFENFFPRAQDLQWKVSPRQVWARLLYCFGTLLLLLLMLRKWVPNSFPFLQAVNMNMDAVTTLASCSLLLSLPLIRSICLSLSYPNVCPPAFVWNISICRNISQSAKFQTQAWQLRSLCQTSSQLWRRVSKSRSG